METTQSWSQTKQNNYKRVKRGNKMPKKTYFQNNYDLYIRQERRKRQAFRERERREMFSKKGSEKQAEKIKEAIADDKNLDEKFSDILKGL